MTGHAQVLDQVDQEPEGTAPLLDGFAAILHRRPELRNDCLRCRAQASKFGPLFLQRRGESPPGARISAGSERRFKGAFSCHSLRATAAATLLKDCVPREHVQYLPRDSDARTADLYNRTEKEVFRNVVDRISI